MADLTKLSQVILIVTPDPVQVNQQMLKGVVSTEHLFVILQRNVQTINM
jgi:hypothetical protein